MRISYWSSDVCSSDLVAVSAALRKYSPMGERSYASLCEWLERFADSLCARVRRLEQDRDELIGAMEMFAEMATVGEDMQRDEGVALQPDDAPAAWPQTNGGIVECVPERSEEHTSELQSLMRISYAALCLK